MTSVKSFWVWIIPPIFQYPFFGFPACSLRLYGSCLTRFAFKTSDINIDVTHPSSVSLLLLYIFSNNIKRTLQISRDIWSFSWWSHFLSLLLSVQMTQPEVLIQVLEILKNSRKLCFVHGKLELGHVNPRFFSALPCWFMSDGTCKLDRKEADFLEILWSWTLFMLCCII